MGRQKKGDFVFTEEAILQKLRVGYMSNPKYAVANLHVFDWESDFLVKTKAGYWYEVEVKISRDDFRSLTETYARPCVNRRILRHA